MRAHQDAGLGKRLGGHRQAILERDPFRVGVPGPVQVLEDSKIEVRMLAPSPAPDRLGAAGVDELGAGLGGEFRRRGVLGIPAEHRVRGEGRGFGLHAEQSDVLQAVLQHIGPETRRPGALCQRPAGRVGAVGAFRRGQHGGRATERRQDPVDQLAPGRVAELKAVLREQQRGARTLLREPMGHHEAEREGARRPQGDTHRQEDVDVLHQIHADEDLVLLGPREPGKANRFEPGHSPSRVSPNAGRSSRPGRAAAPGFGALGRPQPTC